MKRNYVALELELIVTPQEDVLTASIFGGDMINGDFNFDNTLPEGWRGNEDEDFKKKL